MRTIINIKKREDFFFFYCGWDSVNLENKRENRRRKKKFHYRHEPPCIQHPIRSASTQWCPSPWTIKIVCLMLEACMTWNLWSKSKLKWLCLCLIVGLMLEAWSTFIGYSTVLGPSTLIYLPVDLVIFRT
jgi:hypothetical protein